MGKYLQMFPINGNGLGPGMASNGFTRFKT